MKQECVKVLDTKNLTLRPFKEGDEQQMFKNYCSDGDVCKFLTWKKHKNVQETKEVLLTYLKNYEQSKTAYVWAIVLKETNEIIGCVDASSIRIAEKSVNVGFVLGKKYWNKGYMTEALQAVIEFLFNAGYKKVETWSNSSNVANAKVNEKCNMKVSAVITKTENGATVEQVQVFTKIKA